MIPLSILSDLSDFIGCVALATIAGVLGLLPAAVVMPCWIRKRQEVAILFALAALRRGASAMHFDMVELTLQVVAATASALSAYAAVRSLLREVRRARPS